MDGVYTVTLTATNDCGTTTYTQNIAIATAAPVALFDVNSQTGCAPFTVQFNNQSSANATSYQWSFPGGNPSSSTEENPVVVYDNPGTYDVSLTATNTVGDNTYSQSSFITVGSAPTASFDFNLTDASASLIIIQQEEQATPGISEMELLPTCRIPEYTCSREMEIIQLH
ncbi:MAG: PKD domain-containing protein [Saprospiraceae bacterium]